MRVPSLNCRRKRRSSRDRSGFFGSARQGASAARGHAFGLRRDLRVRAVGIEERARDARRAREATAGGSRGGLTPVPDPGGGQEAPRADDLPE
jgi:hypothetical protein